MINLLLAISARHFAARQFTLKSAITKNLLHSMAYVKTPARQQQQLANTISCLITMTYEKLTTHV